MSVINYYPQSEQNNNKNLNYYLVVVLVALLSGFYVQYLADTAYGLFISYLMLTVIILSSLFSLELSVKLFVLLSLITPQFSRTFVEQVVSSNNQEVEQFFSFHSVQFAGLGLSVIAIIFIGFISICKLLYQKTKLESKDTLSFFKGLYFIFAVLLLATTVSCLIGRTPDIRYIISDFRMFIIWGIGALAAILICNNENIIDKIYNILLFSILVIGLRTLFFFANDFISGRPNLEYATQAYIAYPLMFVFAMTIRSLFKRLLMTGVALLAAISMKREDIAFVFLCVMAIFYLIVFLNDRGLRKNALLALMMLVVITSFAIFALAIYSPQSFDFLLYKFDFFSKLISGDKQSSGSVLVRLYELQNIVGYSVEHIYPIFIGMGFGGYFDFSLTGYPIILGVSDYSINELATNKFVRPHSFTNFLFLKGGLIFLTYYLSIIIKMMSRSFRLMRRVLKTKSIYSNEFRIYLFCFLYSIFCVNMFWQPVHNFLFSFLLVLLLVRTKTLIRI
ncbi:hypothetical protein H4F76_02320 [Enterobacter hormaechei]|nr:hypothetical protein [Enterobacter hormaechei]